MSRGQYINLVIVARCGVLGIVSPGRRLGEAERPRTDEARGRDRNRSGVERWNLVSWSRLGYYSSSYPTQLSHSCHLFSHGNVFIRAVWVGRMSSFSLHRGKRFGLGHSNHASRLGLKLSNKHEFNKLAIFNGCGPTSGFL